jgi:hypothetical protein
LAQPYTDKNTLELPEIANSTKFAWLIMILSLLSQQIWIKNVNSPPSFLNKWTKNVKENWICRSCTVDAQQSINSIKCVYISTVDLKLNYELFVILYSYGKLNLVGLAEPLSYTLPPEKYSAFQINMDCWR